MAKSTSVTLNTVEWTLILESGTDLLVQVRGPGDALLFIGEEPPDADDNGAFIVQRNDDEKPFELHGLEAGLRVYAKAATASSKITVLSYTGIVGGGGDGGAGGDHEWGGTEW